MKKVICVSATPVLNTPNFSSIFGGKTGSKLKTDKKGHIKALEFVALKNTVFEITKTYKKKDHYIYEVKKTLIYSKKPLFIDSRFTKTYKNQKFLTPIPVLKPEKILKTLHNLEGSFYVWGGNFSKGIPSLLSYYPPKENIENHQKLTWMMKGVDCSGLLFEATNGYTPRNTSDLLSFGKPVFIENKSIEEIVKTLRPLDLIVYQGHVLIVLSSTFIIESREKKGVIKTPLLKRLKEIYRKKEPINNLKKAANPKKAFVIRRWISL